jgi:DNA-binding NtrC family response regulator
MNTAGVRRGRCGERDRKAIPLVVRIAFAREREATSEGREMAARRCRILVIEDDEHVSALLDQVISLEGYEVELVRPPLDDTAGIDFAAYDVALIDLLLPRGHDGFAMARRASAAGIGVILMSGNRSVSDEAKKLPHPFLEKPFRIARLIETIHQVLLRTGGDCERQTAKSA